MIVLYSAEIKWQYIIVQSSFKISMGLFEYHPNDLAACHFKVNIVFKKA